MKPTEKQIQEIAENLDCGMRCFYNLKTGEIKTLPDSESLIYADEDPFEEESKEIEKNRNDYFEFEGLNSHKDFKIMKDFAETIEDTKLQDILINTLNRPKPFRNFKWQIDNSGDYRQKWFDFKNMRYIQWVKKQIDLNKEVFNE